MTEVSQSDRKWGGFTLLVFGIFVGLPLLFIVACTVMVAMDDGDSDGSGDRAKAIQLCRAAVRDQLKSPKSADFSNEVAAQTTDAPAFRVTGEVDAENSFGASVRSSYVCEGYSSSMRVTSLQQR
jgi:hypothetical protein